MVLIFVCEDWNWKEAASNTAASFIDSKNRHRCETILLNSVIKNRYLQKMDLSVNIGDKIKLNYDVREFHLDKYCSGSQSYSFNNIVLNFSKYKDDLGIIKNDFLLFNAPIILSNYEEELIKIEIENKRKIGYTKSFRIDLLKAIKANEIKINCPTKNKRTQKDNQIYEGFVTNLQSTTEAFICGLITRSERKNKLIDFFQHFYRNIFKDDLEQIRVKEITMTDEEFFSKTWKRYLPRKDYKEEKIKIRNIIFIWTLPPTGFNWTHQFILEGIKRGIDKKTTAKLSFGGLYISKERFGDFNKNQAVLTISSTIQDPNDEVIYFFEIWEKDKGIKKNETKDLWQNIEFKKKLERVIESPTF